MQIRISASVLLTVIVLLTCGCALLTPLPPPTTREQRIRSIPTAATGQDGPIVIALNEQQVPFIQATSDRDAAFGLGVMHAHLRLGQMEILRRISQQRIGELFGPLSSDIEHTLRILDPDKAVPEMERTLPTETLEWITSYTNGINYVLHNLTELPHEFAVFSLERESWSVRDVLSISRLAATEVNWLFWFQLIKLYGTPGFEELLSRLSEFGGDSRASFSPLTIPSLFSGSNSVAVSGKRTRHGSALIASDPHVGLNLPNLWLINGLSSPGLRSVGFSLPGLPIILLGRNQDIAWGATNMMGLTSSLYSVSPEEEEQASERTEEVKNRFWFDDEITIRETKFGPILSDAPLFSGSRATPFSIKWVGHEASDEISTFLNVMRAKNWQAFRSAFSSYRVSAQNVLYADRLGNIGHLLAIGFPPQSAETARRLVGDTANKDHVWGTMYTALDLPESYNPPEGVIFSANNRPTETTPPLTFFANGNSRMDRMSSLLPGPSKNMSLEDLKALQRDVTDPVSKRLSQKVALLLRDDGFVLRAPRHTECLQMLETWEGDYTESSGAALLFHLTISDFAHSYYEPKYSAAIRDYIVGSQAIYHFVERDIGGIQGTLAPLRKAFIDGCALQDTHKTWGSFHRVRLQHFLGNVPYLGEKYRFLDFPANGSSGTLLKAAHGLSTDPMTVRYGQNARHVSDLSSPDENYFVLLGGQDGWLESANFLDQVELWRDGDYLQIPLSIEGVKASFPYTVRLTP